MVHEDFEKDYVHLVTLHEVQEMVRGDPILALANEDLEIVRDFPAMVHEHLGVLKDHVHLETARVVDHEDLVVDHEILVVFHVVLVTIYVDLVLVSRHDPANHCVALVRVHVMVREDHEVLVRAHEVLVMVHEDLEMVHEALVMVHEGLVVDHEVLVMVRADLVMVRAVLVAAHEGLELDHDVLGFEHVIDYEDQAMTHAVPALVHEDLVLNS